MGKFQELQDVYNYYAFDLMDDRGREVFYIRSPLPCFILIASYVYFSISLGPRLMKNKPAFKIDTIIRLYDVIQIICNTYFFIQCLVEIRREEINWQCMPVLHDDGEFSLKIYTQAYWYCSLKIFDLLDTIFFVLRKKFSQVTFLHVYHHAGVILGCWMALRYIPGGNVLLVAFLNSFVHMVMFTYYLLTSINPAYKQRLWWKKYLTLLQMIQFFIFAVHSIQVQLWNTCGFPRPFGILFILQNLFIFALFYDFYVKTYRTEKKVV